MHIKIKCSIILSLVLTLLDEYYFKENCDFITYNIDQRPHILICLLPFDDENEGIFLLRLLAPCAYQLIRDLETSSALEVKLDITRKAAILSLL